MSVRKRDEDTAVVVTSREGPDLPPPASCYREAVEDVEYLVMAEESDSVGRWIASSVSYTLGDMEQL